MTIACPDCGTLEDLPKLGPKSTAYCISCRGDLETTNGRSVAGALALSLSTLLLLIPVNALPLISLDLFGIHVENVTIVGIVRLLGHGWFLLAGLSALFVVVLPFVRFTLLTAVLGAIHFGRRPSWLGRAFGWAVWLDLWAMLDVYLLAGGVGLYRLHDIHQANLSIELGGECFIAAALFTMLLRVTLDRRTVWRAIGGESWITRETPVIGCTICDRIEPLSREGQHCRRCHAVLRSRKPHAMRYTAALLIAALLLFIPANVYPMNISNQLGTRKSYTILDGILDLFKNGLWPLGAVIFCTSVLIPLVKILVLGWCVLSVSQRSPRHLVLKTKMFRIVAEFGRWSKTDPFTIVFFVPLMNFGGLGSDTAGWGATAFMMMTFLTMVASFTFDPRLMWDAAQVHSA